ncbi:hypothetical protein JCM8547_006030 [Rhodosporidiobolus lusitaniae]
MSVLDSKLSVEELLEELLDSLEPGQNPYQALRVILFKTLSPKPEAVREPLLYAASGLACLPFLFLAASLVVRWRKRSLWLFRMHRTSDGSRYILPHYVTSWSIFLLILFAFLQGEIWSALGKAGHTKRELWTMLTWLPAYVSLCFATWTLACTYIIHVKTFTDRYHPILFSPYLVNSLGISTPIILIVLVGAFAGIASKHYQKGIMLFTDANVGLEQMAAKWTGGVDRSTFESFLPAGRIFLTEWRDWFRIVCWTYAGAGLLVATVFVAFAVSYIRILSQHNNPSNAVCPASQEFRRTRNWLVVVTAAFSLVFSFVVATFTWLAIVGDELFTSARANLIGSVLPFYMLDVSCLIVSIILLWRAFHDPASGASNSLPSSSRSRNTLKPTDLPSADQAAEHYTKHVLSSSSFRSSNGGWAPFRFTSRPNTADSCSKSNDFHHPHSAAFENLELQIVPGARADVETNSMGKEESLQYEELAHATQERQELEDCTLRSIGKRCHKRVGSQQGASPVEGVRVTRDAVTVVSLALDHERDEELKRDQEAFTKGLW